MKPHGAKRTGLQWLMAQAKCGDPKCGFQFEDERDGALPRIPCPQCGSTSRDFHLSVVAVAKLGLAVGFKQKRPGYKRFIAEGFSGNDFWRSGSKWVVKERLIDRLADRYIEKVTDPDTGKVLIDQDHPLSQHFGHGSAKKNTSPRV
jgi:hypothetical protein